MGKQTTTKRGFTQRQAEAAKQVGNSTPRAILDAFFPPALRVADLQIQPANLATFMALEKIGSPLANFSDDQAPITAEDIARALVILTLPTASDDDLTRLRTLVGDPEALSTVTWTVASRIPAAQLITLGPVLRDRIQSAFATAIPTRSPEDKGEGPFPASQPVVPPTAGH